MKYATAFEVASITKSHQAKLGYKYMDGVERKAALAAVKAETKEAVVDAMEYEFWRHLIRSPRWDGSIA